jgi:DNA-binding transcriptional LysR family regulator
MQIATFQIFYDLVETASFSKAAEIHGITQSAVSQQIRALEQKFDVTLIERGKKNFSVTEEGRAMLGAAREILQAYESLGKKIDELKTSVRGTIHIAAVHSIGLHELPPYLKEFKKKYREVEITLEFLRSAQVYQTVLDGRADLGLVAFPIERRGIDVESFWKDKLVLICPPSHRLAQRERLRLRDLDGEKFVSFSYDQPTRKAIDQMLANEGIRIQIAMEFDNIETVKRVVEIESGIAIVPKASVREEVKSGRLVAVEIIGADMWRPLGLLMKKKKAFTSVQSAFVHLLHSTKPNW